MRLIFAAAALTAIVSLFASTATAADRAPTDIALSIEVETDVSGDPIAFFGELESRGACAQIDRTISLFRYRTGQKDLRVASQAKVRGNWRIRFRDNLEKGDSYYASAEPIPKNRNEGIPETCTGAQSKFVGKYIVGDAPKVRITTFDGGESTAVFGGDVEASKKCLENRIVVVKTVENGEPDRTIGVDKIKGDGTWTVAGRTQASDRYAYAVVEPQLHDRRILDLLCLGGDSRVIPLF